MELKSKLEEIIQKGNWNKALKFLEEIDLNIIEDPEILQLCGTVYQNNHYFEKAYYLLSRCFKIKNDDYDIAVQYANICIKTLNIQEAEKAIKKVTELNYNEYESHRLLYELYKCRESDLEEQIKILKKLNRLEYTEKYGYELATLYKKIGSMDKCKSECRKLINYFRGGEIVLKAKELLLDVNVVNKNKGEVRNIDKPKNIDEASNKCKTKKKITLDIKKKNISEIFNKKKIFNKDKNKKHSSDLKKSTANIELPPEIACEFENFIGMESVKKHILTFVNEVKLDQKRKNELNIETNTVRGYHFMLLGNPGTGKTTVARAIGRILYKLGIRSSETFIEVDKSGLVGKYIGHTEEQVKSVIMEATGGTLFIDEAYTLYKKNDEKDFGIEAINVLMKEMEDKRDSFSVILAGYKNQMYDMLDANEGLKSRINFIIEIPDYTDDELIQIADKMAEDMGFIITESGKKAIRECINRERVDEKFSNARFIRDLLNQAYRNLANRLSEGKYSKKEMMKFEAEDFGVELNKTPDEEIQEALLELKSLIGLNGVKYQVESAVNGLRVQEEMKNRGIDVKLNQSNSMHMLFRGNPGTGKTTVARIIGRIYKSLGLLKRGDVFIECTRGDFVGKYQGHTAEKTKSVVNRALGGILFIDEAYGLYQGENDTYGKEAIDTLIAEMENKRDKLMVILAGYKTEMEQLLESNSGFKSRINTIIDFEDYNIEELTDIFVHMVKDKGMEISSDTLLKAKELINNQAQIDDFGNARGVRNILENIIRNQNNRIASKLSEGKSLLEKDFVTILNEDIF